MAKLMLFWRFLDVPSGAVLGVYTGTMIVLTICAFFMQRPLPDGTVAAYTAVVSAFTVGKAFGRQTSSALPVSDIKNVEA